VVELQSSELPFQLVDFLAIRVHEGTLAVRVLHDLVDYQLRDAVDVEGSCPNVDGYAKTADQRLIFGDVIGRGG
jgi:hypothetical protein